MSMIDEEKTEIVELMDELWDESGEGAKCAIFSVAEEDGLLEELREFLKANRASTTEDALDFVLSCTEGKPFLEELRCLLEGYKEDQKPGTYNDILTLLFDGISTDERIYVPLVVDFQKRDADPVIIPCGEGSSAIILLTHIPEKTKGPAVKRLIRRVIQDPAKYDMLLFDPGENDLLIPRQLFTSAVDAGCRITSDRLNEGAVELEKEPFFIRRPIDEDAFKRIKGLINMFADKPLRIATPRDDELEFIQVLYTESGLKIRLGYDMSEYEWTEPLVLEGDMDQEKTLDILHRLCVDGESTDTITEVECFKRIKEDSGRNR